MKSWIELDPEKLKANILSLKASIAENTRIIFVVKANAYGHGVRQVAETAWAAGARWYAVAHVSEAQELREILPEAEIIIIGTIDPAEVGACVTGRFAPVVTSLEHARALSESAIAGAASLDCHVKVDTGMGRLGLYWEEALPIIEDISEFKGVRIAGICSHFASADGDSREFFDEQRSRFTRVLDDLDAAGIEVGFKHVSNSGAVFLEPDADWDGIRPGIMLYGYGPSDDGRNISVNPILQWKARVGQVRCVPAGFPVSYNSTYITKEETCIAVLQVGYADGYPRSLSNCGEVLIGGKRMPVVGNVTMSLIMVDLGRDGDVKQGDEAVLIGEQGDESIWADELAAAAGTITYEILTGIKPGEIKVV